jgi:integrase
VDAHPYARRKDLPDLVRFLLGTGVRIGEALAVRWDDVDLDRATVTISQTVVRVPGQGLLAKKPKTRAGVRVLRLPGWLVDVLAARSTGRDGSEPVFPDALGGYRDRNNVERDFRTVREGTEFEWVVPHTYRKTVATVMDAQGLSARTIADQLGHSRISMTQDVYMGRPHRRPGRRRRLGSLAPAHGVEDLEQPA